MELNTDHATPYELSVAARLSAEERERAKASLSNVLPAEEVPGITITLVEGEGGLVEVAEYRAYDAETAFGGAPGGRRQIVELPPLGKQARVSEYDQLAELNRNTPEAVKTALGKTAIALGQSVADRIELARGEVIQRGAITINEGGFHSTVDFGRAPEMSVTAAVLWDDPAAKVIEDLEAWVQAYVDENGDKPAKMLVSTSTYRALKANAQVQSAARNGQFTQFVTNQFVSDFLSAQGLPEIVEYNRKVRRGGILVPVLNPNIVTFLPEDGSGAGSTAWGTTLESRHPNYGIAEGEQAGIVVGSYQSFNPMGLYANSAAIALPVLHEPNKFMSATIR